MKNNKNKATREERILKEFSKEDKQRWLQLSKFYFCLVRGDQDVVCTAMALCSKLIQDLPKEYLETYREYQELISNNKELFRKQD